MSGEENPEVNKLADELEEQVDELQERSKELGEKIDDVRQDWEHKQADSNVPGAVPADSED